MLPPHPLWIVCLITRLTIAYSTTINSLNTPVLLVLVVIGTGFAYNSITGSNREIQLRAVFWHDARWVHAMLFIAAAVQLYYNRKTNARNLLLLDVVFSILYRLIKWE